MKFRFSIARSLLVTLLIAQSIAIVALNYKLAVTKRQLDEYRKELGELVVGERGKLHFVAESLDISNEWRWRIYVPKGKYVLNFGPSVGGGQTTSIAAILVNGPSEFTTSMAGQVNSEMNWELLVTSTHDNGFKVKTDQLPQEFEEFLAGQRERVLSTGYSNESKSADANKKTIIHQIKLKNSSFSVWLEPLPDGDGAK